MEKYNYEKILNSILETKNTAIIILDLNLNIVYLSNMAKEINNIKDYFDECSKESYEKIIVTGAASDKKIVRLNNTFYIRTLLPLKEKGKLTGIIEMLEAQDEDYILSYEIKDRQIKAYQKSEFDIKLNVKNGTVYSLDSIITCDREMKKLVDKAYKTANSSSPVLIYGETGTGKELFAQGIHNASEERRNNMFIAQNCAAIPDTLLESLLFGTTEGSFTGAMNKPGLFDIAKGGTIYLDEINSMNLNLQAKLLRVLQENTYMPIGSKVVKKADVRIIVSFNREPISVIKEGKFRRDLYYRLNVIYFKIPELKDRMDDIKLLTNYFINLYSKKFNKHVVGIEKEALNILENTYWEGNVRELKNNIERIMNFIDDELIKIEHISNFIIKESAVTQNEDVTKYDEVLYPQTNEYVSVNNRILFKEKVEEFEKMIIKNTLNNVGGNVARASRKLGLPRQTLKNKMVKYNIRPFF